MAFWLNSFVYALSLLCLVKVWNAYQTYVKLKAIPTVGPSGFISSWIGAFRFLFHGREIIQEGYSKYRGSAFKVPLVDRWMVIVSGDQHIDDMRKALPDHLSFLDEIENTLQTTYTLGSSLHSDPYHIDVVRSALTRNIAACFPVVRDEIEASFKDEIPEAEDWKKVPAYSSILQIVCRTTNRLFVGLPLCRNPEYRALNIEHTIQVVTSAQAINAFPEFLKPLVANFFTPISRSMRKAEKHLGPIIRDRLEKENEYGRDWPGKPNDLLSWLIEVAYGGERRTVRDLTNRVLALNFAAIHTTSMGFINALYCLAAHPECARPLREEIEAVIKTDGWTKQAMGKMRKLDSFLQEAQRIYGVGALGMGRTVRKDFSFSDGTVVPAGAHVSVAAFATHIDADNYEDPYEFKPWRFSEMREQEGESIRHQMVTPRLDYILFGVGRTACPGRFFAVNELKTLLSHVLLNYDVKMEKPGQVPPPGWFGSAQLPNTKAKVMFRKRKFS
ncbi:cytochrome P450 [Guyanagaster necrorhizus]|uniref:Cytochrome P450 n=1 Tax=Guyanagaster necrorhizus TaxID=856835 RepID=A0A9P7VZE3_9AGAR|nr:cytochrome P450 [Guyanagaster necrorhizus MCA 3950]KAG7449769.1 cytochrome P450 [Guyanagaster necrorhizus MCA 3950]